MDYKKLVEVYGELEKTPARLKKVGIISELLAGTSEELLPKVTLLVQGRLFPAWSESEIGIANLLMVKIISTATGFPENDVAGGFRKTGDFGLVVEGMIKKKRQRTLFQRALTVEKVFENLRELASVEGKGSQEKKFHLVSELLSSAKPEEAKYIVRTVLGDLRIGVAEGVIRDSIAKAFLPGEDPKEAVRAVEWAWFLRPDYGEVACIAKSRGLPGLKGVKLELGKAYHVLLSDKSPGLEEALKAFEHTALEYKYDGARVVIHKKGEKIWLYTRRLENITRQFPEVADFARKGIKAGECIIEGEMIGFDKNTGKPMPFQFLSQRIRRKYDIEKMVKEIPVQVNLFEITYLNGETLFRKPLSERRRLLEGAVKPIGGKFQLAKQLVTRDPERAERFYKEALAAGQEGVIVKNLDAEYQPGRRVGYWLKVKPVLENLDLVITGATWGTGKRAGWLGSYILGCRDPHTGGFPECGMIGTGIKEKAEEGVTFRELTKLLKPHITSEKGNRVEIKPSVVVEVAYEEIQRSPNYSSGWALRFPRVVRLRPDKTPEHIDDVKRIEKVFRIQRGK